MATVKKRGEFQWQARVRRRGSDVTKTFLKKSDALAWARKIESEVERNQWCDTSETEKTSVRELLERFQNEEGPRFRSPRAMPAAVSRLVERLGHHKLAELSGPVLAGYRDSRKKEAADETVRRELGILRAAINVGIKDWGLVFPRGNPVSAIRLPAPGKGRERRLGEDEERFLLEAAAEYEKDARALPMVAVVRLALETGMRRGEIAGLRWENIFLAKRILLLPETKNGDSRRVPLSRAAVEALESIFPKGEGEVLGVTDDALTRAFARVLERARAAYLAEGGKDKRFLADFRFHDLRHEAISRLVCKGLSILEVSAISGHKTLDMLRRYTHVRAEDLLAKLG